MADLSREQGASSEGLPGRQWPVTTKAGIWIVCGLVLACIPCLIGTLSGYGGYVLSEARMLSLPLGLLLLGLLAVFGFLLWRDRARYPRWVVGGSMIAGAVLAAGIGWFAVLEYQLRYSPATVAAFGVATGKPVWAVELSGAGGASTPTVGAGVVFVQTGDSYESPKGRLVAVDVSSGRRLWQVGTDGGICGGAGAGSDPPVVVDGVAVVRSPDGDVRGIDARDGGERWRAAVVGAPGAVADGVVLVGGQTTYTGLDAATGAQRWTRTIADAAGEDWRPAERTFMLGADSVFVLHVSTENRFGIAVLDARTGRELWRDGIAYPETTSQHFVVDGAGTVAAFQAGSGQTLRLVGWDLRTGKQLWTTPELPLNPDGLPNTEIAAHAGTVFHASANGQLVALDARSGAERWTASLPTRPGEFGPQFNLAADQNAVVAQRGDRLWGFDPSTGAQRWSARLDSGNEPESRPAVGGGTVMVPQSTSCIPPVTGGMGR